MTVSAPDERAPAPRAGADILALLAAGVCGAAALLVLGAYLLRATALVAYPWDWSPDEGLNLDYARRALEAPSSLYAHEVVPFPSAYGPLLPFLMAPVVLTAAPLATARLLMLAFVLAGTAAVGWYVGRRGGWIWAGASVALVLAPFDLTFWGMLVRVDGPMLALWLWGVVVLLPRRLESGADHLNSRRLWIGVALLLAAVLVKPTAALHSAPVVLGWFLVDTRSAARLTASLGIIGLALLGLLQIATRGGFIWVNGLWGTHPTVAGQAMEIFLYTAKLAWPVLVLAAGAFLAAAMVGARPWREPTLLPVLGGLTVAPLLAKHGASWNYFLPLFVCLVLFTACALADAARAWLDSGRPGRTLAAHGPPLVVALVALALAITRTFPLPTPADAATARAFYGYTAALVEAEGGPILASRPDLVYFRAGQPVEIEGSSFIHLADADLPGTRGVLERLQEARYTMVVETWPISEDPEWRRALKSGYRHVGGCALGWYFGEVTSHILLRRDLPEAFVFPPGARCAVAAPSLPSTHDAGT